MTRSYYRLRIVLDVCCWLQSDGECYNIAFCFDVHKVLTLKMKQYESPNP